MRDYAEEFIFHFICVSQIICLSLDLVEELRMMNERSQFGRLGLKEILSLPRRNDVLAAVKKIKLPKKFAIGNHR